MSDRSCCGSWSTAPTAAAAATDTSSSAVNHGSESKSSTVVIGITGGKPMCSGSARCLEPLCPALLDDRVCVQALRQARVLWLKLLPLKVFHVSMRTSWATRCISPESTHISRHDISSLAFWLESGVNACLYLWARNLPFPCSQVIATFGDAVRAADGTINRKALGSMVFESKEQV